MRFYFICRHTRRGNLMLAPCNSAKQGICGEDLKQCDARVVKVE